MKLLRDDAVYAPALDGLRGGAVLMVMAFHVITLTRPVFRGAFIGVDIFFVLSGYLITGLLLREFEQRGRISLLRFYMRRVLRLMPALWALLVTVTLLVWLFDSTALHSALRDAAWVAVYLSNWARVWGRMETGYFDHTWSLAIEEQFYFLWPPLLCFLAAQGGARRVLQGALVLALASWVWRAVLLAQSTDFDRLYHGLDTRFDAPMWGCALAAWAHGRGAIRRRSKARMVGFFAVVAAAVVLLASCWIERLAADFYMYGSVVTAWLTMLLIMDVTRNPCSLLRPLLRWKPLVLLGIISYGVYLWHWVVLVFLWRRQETMQTVQMWTLGLAVPLALLSFYFVEQPFLRLKSHFMAGQ